MVENSIFNNIYFIQSLTINYTNVHALNNEQLEKKTAFSCYHHQALLIE